MTLQNIMLSKKSQLIPEGNILYVLFTQHCWTEKKHMNGGPTSSPQALKKGAEWLRKWSSKDPCVKSSASWLYPYHPYSILAAKSTIFFKMLHCGKVDKSHGLSLYFFCVWIHSKKIF